MEGFQITTMENIRERMICPQCGTKGTDIRHKMFVGTVLIIRIYENPGEDTWVQCKECLYKGDMEDFTKGMKV